MDTSDIALKNALNGDSPRLSIEQARKIGPPPLAKTAKKQIPIEAILYYIVEKKLSYRDTAQILGCSERNIGKRLEKVQYYLETDNTYQKARPKILRIHQRRLLEGLTDGKIREMKGGEITKSHGELHHAERLEEDKSTANIHSYREIVQREKELEKELEKVNKEMGAVEVKGIRLLPMREEECG